MSDTIYALASGPGRAGVAVIRISGDCSGALLQSLTDKPLPSPRQARLDAYLDDHKNKIDQGLSLLFSKPKSFTGEDVVELHLHGSPAVIQAIFHRLDTLGARLAEPGEFTRRAFEHGKMDLTEAEGLADLIDAETEAQRQQALAQMSGSLKTLYESWRERLITIMAAVEGAIDFPDEDDVPDLLQHRALEPLDALIEELQAHLDDDHRGEQIREGFSIALIGATNAGKSSLLNALAKRDAAIVTDIPGTTRDIIEVRLVLGGFVVIISDTAGLRDTDDQIEAEGVRRARARAEEADLRLGLVDVSRETSAQIEALNLQPGDALIFNKMDLDGSKPTASHETQNVFSISATTGSGLKALETWLKEIVTERLSGREAVMMTRARHRRGVGDALSALNAARTVMSQSPELAGADLHNAMRGLEGLTGRVDIEDVLDRIFSQFCIGK